MARQQIQRRELRTQERERLFIKRTMVALRLKEDEVRKALSGEIRSTVRINRLAARTCD